MKPHEKIKEMRRILGLGQAELASILGVSQVEVSKLENGHKKFIPNRYINFLQEKNFDLNSFFNDDLKLSKNKQERIVLNEPKEHYGSNRSRIDDENQRYLLFNDLLEFFQCNDNAKVFELLRSLHPSLIAKYINEDLERYMNTSAFIELATKVVKHENGDSVLNRLERLEARMAQMILEKTINDK